jgi:hypothetical protein
MVRVPPPSPRPREGCWPARVSVFDGRSAAARRARWDSFFSRLGRRRLCGWNRNMTLLRDFRHDWGRWSAGERIGAVLIALVVFGASAAMFVNVRLS